MTKDGRLVYARGFGYAVVDPQQPVQPTSLFRIASVSKPITAVGVLQLVDRGRLKLDDQVFGLLKHQRSPDSVQVIDARLKDITIRQLLQHRGGFDREKSLDPMFRSIQIAESLHTRPPAKPDDIIRFMMGRQLDFDPGGRYAYSNFGYCLLGRVIEQVSGTSYEEYVRRELLAPMGIHRMRIGRTLLDDLAIGEVHYYDPDKGTGYSVVGGQRGVRVPRPYGSWYLEAMDAHGGWLASAVDLVRFASRVQRAPQDGLLSHQTCTDMIARPPGPAGLDNSGQPKPDYYGLGWSVRPVGDSGKYNLWHAGQLPGTSAILVIRHDGLCWAVLFNTSRTADGKAPASKIDPLVHQAAGAVDQWPDTDRFDELLRAD